MNKMYNMELVEYTDGVKTKTITTGIFDWLEDAIYSGHGNFALFVRDYIEYKKGDFLPELIQNYIDDKLKDGIEYNIIINVFSTDRKKFKEPKELMKYFNENIANIPNDKLYDFLLSLVEYDTRIYDCRGNYQSNIIIGRSMLNVHSYDLDFTEASCMCRKYRFNYL